MQQSRMESGQNLVLESRERATVTGVLEVVSFDENQVAVETSHGMLTVSGDGLHVEKLTLEAGELVIAGRIDALLYSDGQGNRGSFWSRFF